MLVEQLNTVDNSIVIGLIALFTCIVFIIVAVVNSDERGEKFTNLNPEENKQQNEQPIITEQPTALNPGECCCLACFPNPTPNIVCCGDCSHGWGDCCYANGDCCSSCDCCADCDGCIGCDICIGTDACLGDCCSGCCEVCTPELCLIY